MNKTRILILLALFVCASLWFAPAARARQEPLVPPCKYLLTLTFDTSPVKVDFDVILQSNIITIRNISSDPVYVLGPVDGTPFIPPSELSQTLPLSSILRIKIVDDSMYYWDNNSWSIRQKGGLSVSLNNAESYMIGDMVSGRCRYENNINNDQPIPLPRNVSLVLLHNEQFVNIPATISFNIDPDYEFKLDDYNNKISGPKIGEILIAFFIYLVVPSIIGLYIFLKILKYLVSFINHRRGSD